MASFAWIFSHLFSFLLLSKKSRIYCYFIFLLFLLPLYLNFIFIGDIKRNYINNLTSENFEFGFVFVNNLLICLGLKNSVIIKIYQVFFIIANIYVFRKFYKIRNYTMILAITFASPYFFLGYHNVLRQGLSSSIILASILFLMNKKYIHSILLFFLAQSLHFSSFIFFFISLIVLLFSKYHKFIKYNFFSYIFLTILLISSFYFIFDHYSYLLKYAQRNNDRFVGYIKPIVILITYLIVSLFYLKCNSNFVLNYIFNLRFAFYTMFFAFSFNLLLVEVASRILFFCFLLDLHLIIFTFKNGSLFNRYGSILSLLLYGFASNILTLLNEI
jgi:hypothetical protein